MDRITGPYDGFYIAARSRSVASVWMGEARIFETHPTNFDDPSAVVKLAGDLGNALSELDAVENAERVARDWITNHKRTRSERQ